MSRIFARGLRRRDAATASFRRLPKVRRSRSCPALRQVAAALLFGVLLLGNTAAQPVSDARPVHSLSELIDDVEQRLGGKVISATPDKAIEPKGVVYRLRLLQRDGTVREVSADLRDGSLKPVE